MTRPRLECLFLAFIILATAASASDWPRFRGANFDGISAEKDWSAAWPADGPQQLWSAMLGPGGSSIVISQNRLYTMGNVGNTDIVYCIDAETGKEIWRHTYACPLDKRSFEGGPASTPTINGDQVFTVSHKGDIFCLDALTGAVVWSKNLMSDFKGQRPQGGFAGSALIDGDRVILETGGVGSSTVALNKRDSSLVWAAGDDHLGYSSPIPWMYKEKRAVLLFKSRALVALDLTGGAEFWRFPWKTSWDVQSAVPIPAGDKVLLASGYGQGAALLQIKDGAPVVIWTNQNLCSQLNAAILIKDYLYGISSDNGPQATLNCVNFNTGELKWSQKGLGAGALMAAQLYQMRWQIELFFRWIKGHLRIKHYFGTSANAVKTQIWIAVAVYLMVAILHKQLNLPSTLHRTFQLLSVHPFEKMPIHELLTETGVQNSTPLSHNQLLMCAL